MSSETTEKTSKLQHGHSSYQTWRIYSNRAIQKIAPALGKKSNAQLIFSAVLIVVSLFTTVGFGIYLDGYVIHPPIQEHGHCPAPAFLRGDGCYAVATVTAISSSQTITTTAIVTAGTIQANP